MLIKKYFRLLFLFLFSLLSSFSFSQKAFKIPDAPARIYPINDYSKTLTFEQERLLNEKLFSFEDSTSTEIVVCLVKTLNGDDINLVTAKWGEKWGIGKKEKNNGVIMVIAVKDRKLSIQNGRALEDKLTDLITARIIKEDMVPILKENNYYKAVDVGTDRIIELLTHKDNTNTVQSLKSSSQEASQPSTPKSFTDIIIDIISFILSLFCSCVVPFFVLYYIIKSLKNSSSYSYSSSGKSYSSPSSSSFSRSSIFGRSSSSRSRSSSSSSGSSRSSSSRSSGFGGGGSFGGGGASASW